MVLLEIDEEYEESDNDEFCKEGASYGSASGEKSWVWSEISDDEVVYEYGGYRPLWNV